MSDGIGTADRVLFVLRRDQIPLFNDCIYQGVHHADAEDAAAMTVFRDELQGQIATSQDDLAALRRVLADANALGESYEATRDDLARLAALLTGGEG